MVTYFSMSNGSLLRRIACILAICALLLVAATPSAFSASGATLVGSKTIYSAPDSNTAGTAEAFRATASASGTE